jgi:hypothetical protein
MHAPPVWVVRPQIKVSHAVIHDQAAIVIADEPRPVVMLYFNADAGHNVHEGAFTRSGLKF